MRLKRMLDHGWDPLAHLSQRRFWKRPSSPTNQKAAPTSLGDCGLSTTALSPWVPMHLVTLYYRDQWHWTPSCDLSLPSFRPWGWGWGKRGHELKGSIDRGCVFHHLAYFAWFIFLTLSLKKKKLLLQKFTLYREKENSVVNPHVHNTQL